MSPIQTSSLPCSYSKSPWIDACLSYLAGVEMSTMIVWVRKKDCPQKNPCLRPGKAYLSHSTMAAEIAARTVQGRVHEIWCRWHFPHLSSALDSQVWCTHLYCKVLTFHLNIPFFCHSLSSIMLKRFSTEVAASSFLSRVQAPWVPTSKLVWLRWSRTSLEHFLHSTGLLCWLLFLRTPPVSPSFTSFVLIVWVKIDWFCADADVAVLILQVALCNSSSSLPMGSFLSSCASIPALHSLLVRPLHLMQQKSHAC